MLVGFCVSCCSLLIIIGEQHRIDHNQYGSMPNEQILPHIKFDMIDRFRMVVCPLEWYRACISISIRSHLLAFVLCWQFQALTEAAIWYIYNYFIQILVRENSYDTFLISWYRSSCNKGRIAGLYTRSYAWPLFLFPAIDKISVFMCPEYPIAKPLLTTYPNMKCMNEWKNDWTKLRNNSP